MDKFGHDKGSLTDFNREIKRLLQGLNNHPFKKLVINSKTGKPYVTIWKAIKRAAKAAEITKKVNHHHLRHTFSALAAENGMNPHALQGILGHASIETTNKIYTNVSRDFVGDEARALQKKRKI